VSKAVSVAVQPFEDLGKKVGNMAASAPKYMPIPGTGISVAGATHLIGQAEVKHQSSQIDKANNSPFGTFM